MNATTCAPFCQALNGTNSTNGCNYAAYTLTSKCVLKPVAFSVDSVFYLGPIGGSGLSDQMAGVLICGGVLLFTHLLTALFVYCFCGGKQHRTRRHRDEDDDVPLHPSRRYDDDDEEDDRRPRGKRRHRDDA